MAGGEKNVNGTIALLQKWTEITRFIVYDMIKMSNGICFHIHRLQCKKAPKMTRRFLQKLHFLFRKKIFQLFRDGVSEGQFMKVLAFELRAMRAACSEIDPTYQPQITYLVVQKRHHTRSRGGCTCAM